jgi:hypothetical protein
VLANPGLIVTGTDLQRQADDAVPGAQQRELGDYHAQVHRRGDPPHQLQCLRRQRAALGAIRGALRTPQQPRRLIERPVVGLAVAI